MKFAVVILACVLVAAEAQYNRAASAFASVGNFPQPNQSNQRYNAPQQYRTPQQYKAPQQIQFNAPKYQKPILVKEEVLVPVAPVAAVESVVNVPGPTKKFYSNTGAEASAQIRSYSNEVSPDGSFGYNFETDNGIAAQAQGTTRDFGGNPAVVVPIVQGSYSWTSPDGVPVAISYIADENGYHAQGDAIPTPPPVPAQIARALDYIARTTATRNQ